MTNKQKVAILKKAFAKFGRTGKNWIKGMSAVKKDGGWAETTDPRAEKFCVLGAIQSACGGTSTCYEEVAPELKPCLPKSYQGSVVDFSDSRRRKFADIRALFQCTIKRLSK